MKNWNIKDLKNFLEQKPGYKKEGVSRLRTIFLKRGVKLDIDNESIKDLLSTKKTSNKEESNLILKKVWQTPTGSKGYSYEAEKSNDKYEIFSDLKESLIRDLKNISPIQPSKQYRNKKDIMVEVSIPDFHLGKDSIKIEDQVTLYDDCINKIKESIKYSNCNKILFPIGNDFFNSDNLQYTTTKGTPQFDTVQWQESFRIGVQLIVKTVNSLLEIAPVDIIVVQGNHDYQKSWYLGEIIEAYFTNNNNVTVNNDINEPRKYYKYGNTLLGFTHGDSNRPNDLPLLMAVEKPIEFSQTTTREWHIGHLHKHMHDEYNGVGVKVLPSLCGQDEWHKKQGYISKRRTQLYYYDYEEGLIGYMQFNVN